MRGKGPGKRVTIRLTNELYDKISEAAKNQYLDVAAYLRQLAIKDVTKDS